MLGIRSHRVEGHKAFLAKTEPHLFSATPSNHRQSSPFSVTNRALVPVCSFHLAEHVAHALRADIVPGEDSIAMTEDAVAR